MELESPRSVRVTSEVEILLRDVDGELRDFQALGEFPPEVREQIRKEFLPQRLSDTLNIEGVRVNPRITQAVLEGLALSDTDRYNEQEVMNAIRATDFMEAKASTGEALRPVHIREMHSLVCEELLPRPGEYRERDVEITGASFTPPSGAEIPSLVQGLCDMAIEHRAHVHPIVLGCWMHARFGAIHPFLDGNGRTGRLVQDWILVGASYLPVGIPASRRQEYYDALEAADGGNWMPLVAIVANSQLTTLERARRIAEAPKRRLERIRSLVRASQRTVQQRDYNKYEVWRRRTDGIRDEFQRWASDLTKESPDLQIRTKVWDPISFEKWQEIRERGQTRGTWLFNVNFIIRREPIFSWLFYARRHEFAYTLEYEEMEHGLVGVFLTGDTEPDPRWDFGKYEDPYVGLREMLYVGDELYAYHEADTTIVEETASSAVVAVDLADGASWLAAKDAQLGDVVERFLEECLLKFGLIEGTPQK